MKECETDLLFIINYQLSIVPINLRSPVPGLQSRERRRDESLRSKVIGRETYRQCDNMPICQCQSMKPVCSSLSIINYQL